MCINPTNQWLEYFRRAAIVMMVTLMASTAFSAARSGNPKLDSAIEKANSGWAEAMKTGDAATIAAPYADDAIFIGLDGSCIKGRAEIEKMYRARFASNGPAVSTKIDARNITVDGDLAYESGYAEIGIQKEGATTVVGRRYLTVWHNLGGEWKIVRNVVLP